MDDEVHERATPISPDVPALAANLNNVGYELFRVVADAADGDVVLSPASIGLALGMLDLGATGRVAAALEGLYHYPVGGDARWAAFNTLEQAVTSVPREETAFSAPAPTVTVANREFPDSGFSALKSYEESLGRWFGAGIEPLPIRSDAEGARKRINTWVSERTAGLIPELLPAGAIDPETAMVLVNALYLKATWFIPFEENATRDEPFMRLDGTEVAVPLMFRPDADVGIARKGDFAALDLPYASGELSMLVILPDTGHYDEVQSRLGNDLLTEIDASLGLATVNVYLPRFTSETAFDLVDAIERGLGVEGLFGVADLGGIAPGVFVSAAHHAAVIAVDEKGTEAAAATHAHVARGVPPPAKVAFRADRPFLYVIRNAATGAVLFVGRVLDPSA